MQICIIAAIAENGIIGRKGDLPWYMPEDLKRFRALTTGHHILMGRKTWQSIGKPLPDRQSVVITRNSGYEAQGAQVASSLDEAVQLVKNDDQAFIIGGEQIYNLALPIADRFYLTRVHAQVAGDVYFPYVDWSQWRKIETQRFEADAQHRMAFSFEVFDRVSGAK